MAITAFNALLFQSSTVVYFYQSSFLAVSKITFRISVSWHTYPPFPLIHASLSLTHSRDKEYSHANHRNGVFVCKFNGFAGVQTMACCLCFVSTLYWINLPHETPFERFQMGLS